MGNKVLIIAVGVALGSVLAGFIAKALAKNATPAAA